MENKILEQIKKSETAMLDTLAQIVNIDSGYDALEGIDEVAHIIGDFLTPYGFEVQYIETSNAPTHVLAKRPRPGKKKVMLMGHMDTVFPKGTAAARPIQDRRRQSLWSRCYGYEGGDSDFTLYSQGITG